MYRYHRYILKKIKKNIFCFFTKSKKKNKNYRTNTYIGGGVPTLQLSRPSRSHCTYFLVQNFKKGRSHKNIRLNIYLEAIKIIQIQLYTYSNRDAVYWLKTSKKVLFAYHYFDILKETKVLIFIDIKMISDTIAVRVIDCTKWSWLISI